MIKAILFDLDGTIGDTLPLCISAFKKSIEPIIGRVISEEEIIAKFGPSEEGVIMALLQDRYQYRYQEGIDKYLFHYENLHHTTQNPFEGIRETITYLKAKKIILGVVTGKGLSSTQITLQKYNLYKYFDIIETGSPYGPRKVEALQSILYKYNLKSNEAIYIGDSTSDILDAKKLNMPVYAACWDKSSNYDKLNKLNPDNIFLDVNSLYQNLKKIFDMGCSQQNPR